MFRRVEAARLGDLQVDRGTPGNRRAGRTTRAPMQLAMEFRRNATVAPVFSPFALLAGSRVISSSMTGIPCPIMRHGAGSCKQRA